jgi:Ca-activated chloride channel family protein
LDDVISNLYDRVGAPALTDAKLSITVDGKEGRARQMYPKDMYDLFSGDQLVIVGRYRRHGSLKIKLSGDFLGKRQEYVFEDELPKQTGSGKNVFVERLWATRRIGQIIDDIDLHGENQELVDELIVLSKRHGILTPYTAYLAEEQTDLNDVSRSRRMAQSNLRDLQNESGESAFQQRVFKGQLRSAGRAATPAAASDALEMESMRLSRRGAISGGGGANAAGNRAFGLAPLGAKLNESVDFEADDSPQSIDRVKQIASKTFYLRAGRYVDSDATQEQIDGAIKIEQFSDEYFDLLKDLDEDAKAYFAEESELLVVLKGKTYLIIPPKPKK